LAAALLAWLAVRRGLPGRAAARLVERRLGGYRHLVHAVDEARPTKIEGREVHVAVVGGGLAGIAAASTLGERGAKVTLFERNAYLGGKIGAWKASIAGREQTIEHGFHAFFRQYYNLNRFLDRLGLRQSFAQIEDYLILDAEHRPLSFGEVATAPGVNIVDLGRRGFYRWRDVVRKNTRDRLNAFVRFDMEQTYRELDSISFARFCDEAELPKDLRVAFRTFARAFFANETELSTADVVRAFHFYYLGHDEGLMYDYPAGDYEATLLAPIRTHLRAHDVDLRLDHPVQGVQRGTHTRFRVEGDDFDWVVIAADIPGAQAIVEQSPWLQSEQPDLVSDIRALRTSNGYAVWRVWVDTDVRAGLPTFVNVDRKRVLDSVTLYHRITNEARSWVQTHGGAVLELHSYALPADVGDESDVKRLFLEELQEYFPELEGMTIAAEALQVRRDFPAFAPGQRAHRPEPELPVDGLLLAGDWVRLPYPMTHMEAAFTSGLVCANHILARLDLRQEPIYSVAPRGLLTPGRP
jgi:isorenieratene synthase